LKKTIDSPINENEKLFENNEQNNTFEKYENNEQKINYEEKYQYENNPTSINNFDENLKQEEILGFLSKTYNLSQNQISDMMKIVSENKKNINIQNQNFGNQYQPVHHLNKSNIPPQQTQYSPLQNVQNYQSIYYNKLYMNRQNFENQRNFKVFFILI
jgi:hypothetical protein